MTENLIAQQIALATKINKNLINFKKDSRERKTVGYLETRAETARNSWKAFTEVHNQIFQSTTADERKSSSYFAVNREGDSIYDEAETLHEELLSSITDLLYSLKPPQAAAILHAGNNEAQQLTNRTNNDIRLPRIKIESFNGSYDKWISFKNLYT